MRTLFLLTIFLFSHSVFGSSLPTEIQTHILSFANKQDRLDWALVRKENYLPSRRAGDMKEKMLALAKDLEQCSQPWAQDLFREIYQVFHSNSKKVNARLSVCKGFSLRSLAPLMPHLVSLEQLKTLLQDAQDFGVPFEKKYEVALSFNPLWSNEHIFDAVREDFMSLCVKIVRGPHALITVYPYHLKMIYDAAKVLTFQGQGEELLEAARGWVFLLERGLDQDEAFQYLRSMETLLTQVDTLKRQSDKKYIEISRKALAFLAQRSHQNMSWK
jgi:hypothetical protein